MVSCRAGEPVWVVVTGRSWCPPTKGLGWVEDAELVVADLGVFDSIGEEGSIFANYCGPDGGGFDPLPMLFCGRFPFVRTSPRVLNESTPTPPSVETSLTLPPLIFGTESPWVLLRVGLKNIG